MKLEIVKTEIHGTDYELKFDEIKGNIVLCPNFVMTAFIEYEALNRHEVIVKLELDFENGTYDSKPFEKPWVENGRHEFPIKFLEEDDLLLELDAGELELLKKIKIKIQELTSTILKENFKKELDQLEIINVIFDERRKRDALEFSNRRSVINLALTIRNMTKGSVVANLIRNIF